MTRTLGRTGLEVSPLAFGAFKIGRNEQTKYPDGYELPSEEDADSLLNTVLDCGINLIDTAPAYGESEARIGRHLHHRRDEFLISTKVGETFSGGVSSYAFDEDSINASIESSLRNLRCDHIDILLVHSDGQDQRIIQETNALETLDTRRRAGDIRFIGFSGKTVDGHVAAINSGLVDVLMVEFNPQQVEQQPVLDAAIEAGVGVLVKKGLASGRVPAAEAIPFCLAPEAVASVVVGTLEADHLRANAQLAIEAIS